MLPLRSLRLVAAPVLLLALLGCDPHDHGHEHGHGPEGHSHTAPHGGHLVELGDHFANLELVLDAETGTLRAYLLNGHAEKAIEIVQDRLELACEAPSGLSLSLGAQRSALLDGSEKPTHFEATDDALKGAVELRGRVVALTALGKEFRDLPFRYTPASPSGH